MAEHTDFEEGKKIKQKKKAFLFLDSGSLSIVFLYCLSFPSSPPSAGGVREERKKKERKDGEEEQTVKGREAKE